MISPRSERSPFLSRLPAFLGKSQRTEPRNPVERGLADLWQRTTANQSAPWRDRLAGCLPNVFDDALWEIDNLTRSHVPEPVDYLYMRRQAGGAGWAAQLVEFVLGVNLPAGLRNSSAMRRLNDAFADVVDLHNDLVSYRREIEYEQEINNGVVVTQQFLGGTVLDAAMRVRELLDARLELFEYLAAVEIMALLAADGMSPDIIQETCRYLGGLRDWLAGDYQWHRETGRYRESSWRRPPERPMLHGPQGLGTSAARLGDLAIRSAKK